MSTRWWAQPRRFELSALSPRDFVMRTLLLPLKNLRRYRRRTTLALCVISFGVAALLLAGGFMEWLLWATREAAIQGRLGHIQVTRPGYETRGSADPFAFLLPRHSSVEKAIANFPHVRVLAPRLDFTGLLSHGDVTVPFLGQGVDPAKEAHISVDFRISDGKNLLAGDRAGAILGAGLARAAGVKPGDSIVLLASTSSGGLNAVRATVRGIFHTSNKMWNDSALRIPIGLARHLVQVSGAQTWVLLLDSTDHTNAVLHGLRMHFGGAEMNLQFTPWYRLAPFYEKTVKLFARQLGFVRLTVGLVIILSISNVLIMGILERTREIGTMMAMGIRRRTVLRLFVYEGFWLGMVGSLLGLATGLLFAKVISAIGIPMPPAPGMDAGFTGHILVTWPLATGAVALAVATTLVASVYPAWKASRFEIADALRHGR